MSRPVEASHQADDSASAWFLSATQRGNPASAIRAWTVGNHVYLVDFRGDTSEQLAGPGTGVGEVLARVAARGTKLFGLVWRSQPDWLDQSEGANAELVRSVSAAVGEMLLDSRTRRAGSHHQKFVVIRHPGRPEEDIAFRRHRPRLQPQ